MLSQLPSPDDIKLIVSDVDGTLLTSEGKLHPKTISAFHKLRVACPNLPIIIASGKQYNSCLWIREVLGFPLHFPSVHCNGAIIYGGESPGKIWRQNALEPEVVKHVVDSTRQYGTFIFTEDSALLVSEGEGIHKKDWCEIGGKYDVGIRDCTREPERSKVFRQVASGELVVPKVTICVDDSDLDVIKKSLEAIPRTSPSPLTITRAIPFIFEAMSPDVHKGTAVTQICENLGNIPLEQVLVFGDGENDVPMFERVGHAVAMSNGMRQALAAAKYTTPSSDEGGVGQFIEKVWNL